MSAEETGVVVFCATSVIVSVIAHALARRSAVASAASATVSTIMFSIFAYLKAGHLDPFFLIALVVGWFWAYIIAYIVGTPFRVVRTRRAANHATLGHERPVSDNDVQRRSDWVWATVTFFIVFMLATLLLDAARQHFAPRTTLPGYAVVGIPLLVAVASNFMLFRLLRRERLQALLYRPGHCKECDYDLTGNVSGVCPECGTRIES